MTLSDQIPFDMFTEALGEPVIVAEKDKEQRTISAVIDFRDEIDLNGRQYQYLELEIDVKEGEIPQGTPVIVRKEVWYIRERLRQLYTGSYKYKASNA